jgi:geranylgeranyl diphosphate synthase type I
MNLQQNLKSIGKTVDSLLAADPFALQFSPDFLPELVETYPKRGGKRLRPALTAWFCGMLGGDPKTTARTGLAIELFHNWSLVHDDIIDDDDSRRGKPSCHRLAEKHLKNTGDIPKKKRRDIGRSMAILAGDGLLAELSAALLKRLSGWVTPQLLSGEALDVIFEQNRPKDAGQIEHMVVLKTGILLQFAAEAGTMIGLNTTDFGNPDVRRAGIFGARAGLAFQLQDDLLGLFGNEADTGKSASSDLRRGKYTVIMAEALSSASSDDAKRLEKCLGNPKIDEKDLDWVRKLVEETGTRERVTKRGKELVEEARACLAEFPDNPYRNRLESWTDFLVDRSA